MGQRAASHIFMICAEAGYKVYAEACMWLSCRCMPLQVQHQLDKLLGGLMSDILQHKPQDPLQFIIDSLTLGPEHAMQVRLPIELLCP
jgi:hypothetical protein